MTYKLKNLIAMVSYEKLKDSILKFLSLFKDKTIIVNAKELAFYFECKGHIGCNKFHMKSCMELLSQEGCFKKYNYENNEFIIQIN